MSCSKAQHSASGGSQTCNSSIPSLRYIIIMNILKFTKYDCTGIIFSAYHAINSLNDKISLNTLTI